MPHATTIALVDVADIPRAVFAEMEAYNNKVSVRFPLHAGSSVVWVARSDDEQALPLTLAWLAEVMDMKSGGDYYCFAMEGGGTHEGGEREDPR